MADNSILIRLDGLKLKYEEIGQKLTDPEVIADVKQFVQLTKEYKELEPIIETSERYRTAVANLAEAKDILANDKDEDMREMAREEIAELEPALVAMEEEIKLLLIPKDPQDDKNAIVEIRGGTGGDEAALFAGDLLNQCTGSTFGLMDFSTQFIGIYGACSTMAEGLLLSSIMVDNKVGKNVVATTSSHFCTAERQYRYPLDYGGQRTPTSQGTATASGAVIVSDCDMPPYVRAVTIGRIVDMGVTDANNMGAAMAPAAYETLKQFFTDTKLKPERFDYIVTGDLGKIGSKALYELLERDNIDISKNHKDCGMMIFDFENQDVHAGGSGCGCAASMLCGYFLPKLKKGEIKNILFMATGALLSPTINQQGESIPGIAHLVWISDSKGD